jgi:NADH-quinone oxidoreductase subunit C
MAEEPKSAKAPAVMAVVPWDGEIPELLRTHLGSDVVETSLYLEQPFAIVTLQAVLPALELLQKQAAFDYLVDITAVDYAKRDPRFELVYVLYSYSRNERIRLKALVGVQDQPASAVGLFVGANWLEREVADMFGISFLGHPDPRRILMPEDWSGYPLRKDYGIVEMDNHWVRKHLGIESGQ